MLIINGGPGMNSDGFSGIAQTLTQYDFQTITYDQRGAEIDVRTIRFKNHHDGFDGGRHGKS